MIFNFKCLTLKLIENSNNFLSFPSILHFHMPEPQIDEVVEKKSHKSLIFIRTVTAGSPFKNLALFSPFHYCSSTKDDFYVNTKTSYGTLNISQYTRLQN